MIPGECIVAAGAIETQRFVRLEKMVMRADLNRAIAGVCNGKCDRCEFQVCLERRRISCDDDFSRDHGRFMIYDLRLMI